MALVYLLHRFFFRFTDFFHHWYVDGSQVIFMWLLISLERLDKIFAVGASLRFFSKHASRNKSFFRRTIGAIFNALRVFVGILVYSLLLAIFLSAYLIWVLVPLTILYLIFLEITAYAG